MPIYDYKCSECEHCFEQMQLIANRNKPTREPCPECGSTGNIEIVIGMPEIGDSVKLGLTKPDKGMQEIIQRMEQKTGQKVNSKFFN